MDYDKAKAGALKVLGKDAKFPKLPGDIAKDNEAFKKANEANIAARDDFEKKILAVKQAAGKVLDTAAAYKDVFEGSDFGLDPKDKDQKKQIDDATKILTVGLDADIKKLETLKTVLEAVMKQISSIKKALDAGGG
jgi:hypothetical protein